MVFTADPTFSLLIKPAGADCNLRCNYCFYLEKANLYPGARQRRMSDEVLERLVSSYMATRQPQYGFAWQGGEPTLMGTAFFRRATELQQKYGRPQASVANGLQTNGTLIDDELAEHLAARNFLVGVSIDGPPELHDMHRKTVAGGDSHFLVQKGVEILHRHGVEFNILSLINSDNIAHPQKLYRYLVKRGYLFQQYIPCVEFDSAGNPMPFSVDPLQWGDFLCRIFDLWYQKDTRRVSIRLFDSILVRLVDGVANACTMSADCRQYFLVEHNGDVYPCDFFAEPQLKLGNIMENDWVEMYNSAAYREFGANKSRLNEACRSCPWLTLCAGDCPRHRYASVQDPLQLSYLCEGWKKFYEYTLPRFEKLADTIRSERARLAMVRHPQMQSGKVGRNAPCPCGSGRKYKHCCAGG